MSYEILCTAVRDRADLLDRTLSTLLANVDELPTRILVHEDHRPGVACPAEPTTRAILDRISAGSGVEIVLIESKPGGGLARGLLRLLEATSSEFVLYTQEDFDAVRPLPVAECLGIMQRHDLWHVRFNKRKTMRCKGEDRPEAERFYKVECEFGGKKFCVSDHWYFQTSLWSTAIARDGFSRLVERTPRGRMVDFCEVKFNQWLNTFHGGDIHLRDPAARKAKVRTFIWGPVAEPAFIRHTGSDRRSQGWEERKR